VTGRLELPELRTPVAIWAFRRPETTRQVAQAVAAARPPLVLINANAPDPGNPREVEGCRETRAVLEEIDWPCEVRWNLRDEQVSIGWSFADGLRWVFEQTERAIILEDDCLPVPTFFAYCDELLERYADDPRVGMITGTNYQFGKHPGQDSYFFLRMFSVWGWATWRRTWAEYDFELADWPDLRDSGWLGEVLESRLAQRRLRKLFDAVHADPHTGWDYQLLITCWRLGALTAVPRTNLVRNIGLTDGHYADPRSPILDMPAVDLEFPLRHPATVEPSRKAGKLVEDMFLLPRPLRVMHQLRAMPRRRYYERSLG
jgi:hypothetical protein